jgi:hypothetical protein
MERNGNQLSRYGTIANPIAVPPNAKIFFVAGSDTVGYADLQNMFPVDRDGETRVFTTIQAAVDASVDARGDIIYVMPGHVETVTAAAGLELDKEGLTLIGYGNGDLRPQINFTTAVGADMNVGAANITMENFRFTGGFDALTGPIDVNAANFTLRNIVTQDVTGQATDFIVTDANADGLTIDGWIHKGAAAAGADTAISIVGGDNISIDNFDIDGNFAVAAIENVTTAAVNLNVGARSQGNLARTRNAADVIFTAVATTTGFVNNIFSRLQDNAANITEALVGADMQFGPNLPIVNADGELAFQWNGTASSDA